MKGTTPAVDRQFIERQRQYLTRLRAALLSLAGHTQEEESALNSAGGEPHEYEDDAQRLAMLELDGQLITRDLERLRRVERALAKIEAGTYGLSDLSGEPIPRGRLDAVPESTLTLAEEQARDRELNSR